jgi:hypothetical protein
MKKTRSRRRAVIPTMRVNLAGDWKACSRTMPKGCTVIGTVTTGQGDTGALVKLATTGAYVKVTDGVIAVLNQTRVIMALEAIRHRENMPAVEMVEIE